MIQVPQGAALNLNNSFNLLNVMGKISQPIPTINPCYPDTLSKAEQVTAICRASYYQLRQLRGVVQSLTPEATKTLVHVFISCRLDNCNALLYSTALRTAMCKDCSQCRTLQRSWSLVLGVLSTSRRSYARCTSYSPSASRVQAGNACPQVFEWPGPDVPG